MFVLVGHLFAIIFAKTIMVSERQLSIRSTGNVLNKRATCRSKPDTLNFADHSV